MESVIVAAPAEYDLKLRARLEQLGPISTGAGGEWIVDNGKSRVYVARSESVNDELEPERLAAITSKMAKPVFYSIDFSDLALCKKVMIAIVDDPELLVDNDHGVLLSGADFVRVLRSQAEWDWRTDGHRTS
jgi:hypothetical protein